jgi:hypothetical protein
MADLKRGVSESMAKLGARIDRNLADIVVALYTEIREPSRSSAIGRVAGWVDGRL